MCRFILVILSNISSDNEYIVHLLIPFLLNLISTIILIAQKSRRKLSLHTNRTYNGIFREELRQYKHLLIGPVVLVVLALSDSISSLYHGGYWISFIPSILTFMLFILPSEFYKKELRTILTRYRRNSYRTYHWCVTAITLTEQFSFLSLLCICSLVRKDRFDILFF